MITGSAPSIVLGTCFSGKRYAVLGLARSGLSAVRTLVKSGAHVMAWDSREEPRHTIELEFGSKVELTDPVLANLAGFDGVVVSPGVPLNRHPITAIAAASGVPLIGDIELFALARPDLPAHRLVAITGTNGKSTTTALVHHLLQSAALPVRMGGNIGLPVLGHAPLPAGGVYVLELSSYQLDLTYSLDADVTALLNLSPDHLDRYDGFEGYCRSKERLFAMQRPQSHAVFGTNDAETLSVAAREELRRGPGFVHRADGSRIAALQADWPTLQGPHNLQNAAAAVEIVEALGLSEGQWRPAMATFKGLPHRMERVAEAGGVLFINDSKATNPASAAPALAAFPPKPSSGGSGARVHWILGGLPKGEGLDECLPFLGNVAAAYTIGEAGPKFANLLEPYVPVHRSEMLCEAIRQAISDARPGDVVLLSPACASFDQFRDYEARGDTFRQVVGALLEGGSC